MTLTLQALLLLLLYLPGALFWAFLTDHASSFDYLPVVSPSYSVGAAYALILSIIFQGLGLILSPTVRTTVTDLLLLASSSQSSADSVRNFPLEHLTYLCFYFCILCLAAAMSGRFCQWVLIEQYHLDLRFDFLRFYPRWVYLFKGYDSPLPPTQQMVVAADLLTDVGGQLTLYSGFVTGYWFDETTRALDVIVLDEPTRQSDLTTCRSSHRSERSIRREVWGSQEHQSTLLRPL